MRCSGSSTARLGASTGILLAAVLTLSPAPAKAQVGEVVFAKGAATGQSQGAGVRFLGKGSKLQEGDVITTASRSFAIIRLADDSRITLRPNTVFALEKVEPAPEAEGASALLRLFKGGLRAITGLIAKRNRNAYRLATPTATIGIRGTDFEARLCDTDCAEEASAGRVAQAVSTRTAAGRVVNLRGTVDAEGEQGESRRLALGDAVFPGDIVQTARRSFAIIEYRDRSRMSLGTNSRLKIDGYNYDESRPAESRSVFSLLRGGLRVLTGLLSSGNRNAFRLRTKVATIGIRGTGFDLSCLGECEADSLPPADNPLGDGGADAGLSACQAGSAPADQGQDGLVTSVWDGSVSLNLASCTTNVAAGEVVAVSSEDALPARLDSVPGFMDNADTPPRPDQDDSVDPTALNPFAAQVPGEAPPPGLYVFMHDGETFIELENGERLNLAPGESGYAAGPGQPLQRLQGRPNISPTPNPFNFDDPSIQDVFQLFDDPNFDRQTGFQCLM